jgi:hypothetical protein
MGQCAGGGEAIMTEAAVQDFTLIELEFLRRARKQLARDFLRRAILIEIFGADSVVISSGWTL